MGACSRFACITSCSSGAFGGIVNQQILTEGGGNVLSMGATTTTYIGAFVMLSDDDVDVTFRTMLAKGEAWGPASVMCFPYDDKYRAIFYGDLSIRAMASERWNIPVANFGADNMNGNAPLAVQFTDKSIGAATAWAWDFDCDGTIDSTSEDPQYTYSTPGIYSVSLAVTGSCGSNTETKIDYITVTIPPPVAGFSADNTTGEAPLAVQFIGESAGAVTSWAWDFDCDGTVDSTDEDPEYTYNTPGTYSVSLTATGPGGSDTETKTGYITVNAPPAISVLAPNGGESFKGKQAVDISWNSTSFTGSVSIEFYNGSSWETLVASIEDNGAYLWTVPNITASGCKVRVSNAAGGAPTDESDGTFTITAVSGGGGGGCNYTDGTQIKTEEMLGFLLFPLIFLLFIFWRPGVIVYHPRSD
jgi:PKD repeat protein